jgi:hypothetical protein
VINPSPKIDPMYMYDTITLGSSKNGFVCQLIGDDTTR